jgi:hypothetical protein
MRRLLRLIVILIVLFGGYWAYFVFAASNPNDPLGVEITRHLPASARSFACGKLKERFGDIQTPQGCAEFGSWQAAPDGSDVPVPGQDAPEVDASEVDAPETAAP